MKIGGLQKVSLVDYPGKVAASVFTIGCNFRCGFCHNPELVVPEQYATPLDEVEVLDFLKKRIGKLEAIVISGGEPTLHKDLPEFIKKVKAMGYLVKLDSQGSNPDVIENLFSQNLLDFIAMDIKAPLDQYAKVMTWPIDPAIIKRSIHLIINSGVPHEFRTTVVKELFAPDDIITIGEAIKGADRYALQHFKPAAQMVNTEKYKDATTYSDEEFEEFRKIMLKYVKTCVIH